LFNFSVTVIKKLMEALAVLFGSFINFSCDKRSALTLLNPHGIEEGKTQDCVYHYNLHMYCGYKRLATGEPEMGELVHEILQKATQCHSSHLPTDIQEKRKTDNCTAKFRSGLRVYW
jgi:hypothetical protein